MHFQDRALTGTGGYLAFICIKGRVSGFIECGVSVGGRRRESRFDTNPRYMAARNVKAVDLEELTEK